MRQRVLALAAGLLVWGAVLGVMGPAAMFVARTMGPGTPAWIFSVVSALAYLLGAALAFLAAGIVMGVVASREAVLLAKWFSLVLGTLAGVLVAIALLSYLWDDRVRLWESGKFWAVPAMPFVAYLCCVRAARMASRARAQ